MSSKTLLVTALLARVTFNPLIHLCYPYLGGATFFGLVILIRFTTDWKYFGIGWQYQRYLRYFVAGQLVAAMFIFADGRGVLHPHHAWFISIP